MSVPAYSEISVREEHLGGEPPLNPSRPFTDFSCRLFDIVLAAFFILIALPLCVVLAVAIKIDSPGSVLFLQTRVGKDGREFPFIKFRSMRADAEKVRDVLAAANEASGPLFKIRQDPRITRVGKIIRKHSIDELPQLLNVLRGEMSLVGPRPALPCEVATYGDYEKQRLCVLPGLTGLWQVSGRSDLDFDQAIALDLEYIRRRSVWYNIVLLFRTVSVVITGHGAY